MAINTANFITAHINNGLTRDQALDMLTTELGIAVKRYPEDNIALLDYCQLDSPKTHPVVIECRSLIVSLDTSEVVSRKLDRFFNAGEAPAYYHDFDLSRSVVLNKEDGSLIGIYYNPHTALWEISTRGMAKAEGPHPLGEGTFREAVIVALGLRDEAHFQETMARFDDAVDARTYTFVMEYCSHRNMIVTPYNQDQMFLLAVTTEYGEWNPLHLYWWTDCFEDYGIAATPARTHPLLGSMDELIAAANQLTGMAEGFVVYDPVSGKRAKVKGATYLVAHGLRGNNPLPTRKNLLELVFDGNASEFVAYFPVWKDMVDAIEQEVQAFTATLNTAYSEHKHITDQKQFALAVKDIPGCDYLFKARKFNTTPTEAFLSSKLLTKQRSFGI